MTMIRQLFHDQPRLSLADYPQLGRVKAALLDMSPARCPSMLEMPLVPNLPLLVQHQVELTQLTIMFWSWTMRKQKRRRSMLFSICRLVNGKNNSKKWPSELPVFACIACRFDVLTCWTSATPVPFGRGRGKPVNVPDHPPPPGYLCYRCREKGLSL